MLHDAIPIERPDLVTPLGSRTHRWIVTAAARHASGLIFTTQAARESVLRVLQPYRDTLPMTTSLALPVAPSFLTAVTPDPVLAQHAYFIVVGAIEPRKNLPMLLNVWAELSRRRGNLTPKLVIAGTPARGGQPILTQLRARASRQGHVVIASDLPSPVLRQLVANARALLMPSLAEGFGLPIVEALAIGTPVLASDLAAHREVGEALAIYLDATDEVAWLREVDRFTDGDDATISLRHRIATYRPMKSVDYFQHIAGFLESVC
jgi:glycosyltransferase involved in cell wall biosynthesis